MSSTLTPILPGSALGIVGSGQLGRMLAMAAQAMGYHVHVYSPEADSPAGQVCAREWVGVDTDSGTLVAFAQSMAALTFEFENLSAETLSLLAEHCPLRPSAEILYTTQHRQREKTFLARHGFPTTPFACIQTMEDLALATRTIPGPWILKTAAQGYDGKGQVRVASAEDAPAAFEQIGRQPAVLESQVDFVAELSVIVARNPHGEWVCYGPIENRHHRHILDVSMCPGTFSPAIVHQATTMAGELAETLDLVGLLCLELFLTRDETLLVNELAPRPHNSGHYSIEACSVSQFEQHIRAMCGLPLVVPEQPRPAVMVNLLGDLWGSGEPDWTAALGVSGVHLHLYGKAAARPGRKMGHLTVVADTMEDAMETALAARHNLTRYGAEVPSVCRDARKQL